MAAVIPDFSGGQSWGLPDLMQTSGVVSIFYDVGQGQGWQRVIPMDGSPHLPNTVLMVRIRAAIGRATRS